MKLKLAVEPRPSSTWRVTLADRLPKTQWDKLRRECYQRANYECQVCGDKGSRLHAHEVWAFDDKRKLQKLVDISCRCEMCHDVHHFGRSTKVYSPAYREKLIAHWCKVNELTREDFEAHLKEVMEKSKRRAKFYYNVKIGRYLLK